MELGNTTAYSSQCNRPWRTKAAYSLIYSVPTSAQDGMGGQRLARTALPPGGAKVPNGGDSESPRAGLDRF
jgi:hypothetical protein